MVLDERLRTLLRLGPPRLARRPLVIDTGPFVTLLNRRDRYHAWVRELLDTVESQSLRARRFGRALAALRKRFARVTL